ncbi:MAG: hypothetical protein C4B59_03510 [Candidatus Methanogaster sp.]|uniref:Uncharacterized protein n=1 Tax=Candidatus Methanogaster sp. TaxID=3386292 RepID=A0AC61L5R2_9EURY|nr:MAG: hypothetical protein C4B59_03510 [ANME-2 cluster archaeon]
MTNLTEQKQKANEIRKAGDFGGALPIYKNLWKETEDKFDGAGLLHCLRKLKLFDEAIIFANELIAKHPDFDWCRNEVIWTYISGKLNKLEEGAPLEKVVQTAQKIMNLNPDGLAAKIVIFKVLKSAKASNDWELVNEWVVKIDPKSLSTEPMMDMSGVRDWSDQSFWYNYRIRGLVETGNPNEAIALVDEISERYPKQRKLFLRLKARSYLILNNLTEAEAVYQNLCSVFKPDWWLLHEYSKVIRDIGRKEDALKLMYQAASSNSKLAVMVSLFEDIGMLCKEMGKNEEARAHLVLCKNIRYEESWSVHESVLDSINELNKIIGDNNEPNSIKEALNICRSYWKDLLGEESVSKSRSRDKRKIRKSLLGKVSLGLMDRPFCFIITKDDESIFCFKSDLPSGIEDGGRVTFDAIPSFDRKKNKKSWKASNIRK